MTRPEFDAWIDAHYSDLLRVSQRLVGSDAEDAVQSTLAAAVATESYRACATTPLTWFVENVKGFAANARRGRKREKPIKRTVKILARAGFVSGRKRPAPRAE